MQYLGSFSNDDGDVKDDALEKVHLYFTLKCCNCKDLFSTPVARKTCSGLIYDDSVSHCGSCSPKYVGHGHFTFLFCVGRI